MLLVFYLVERLIFKLVSNLPPFEYLSLHFLFSFLFGVQSMPEKPKETTEGVRERISKPVESWKLMCWRWSSRMTMVVKAHGESNYLIQATATPDTRPFFFFFLQHCFHCSVLWKACLVMLEFVSCLRILFLVRAVLHFYSKGFCLASSYDFAWFAWEWWWCWVSDGVVNLPNAFHHVVFLWLVGGMWNFQNFCFPSKKKVTLEDVSSFYSTLPSLVN